MTDRRYELLVALHELVEALLCQQSGVSQERVDAFDKAYEAKRPLADKDSEPGDDPAAPYNRQHVIASVTERLAADLLRSTGIAMAPKSLRNEKPWTVQSRQTFVLSPRNTIERRSAVSITAQILDFKGPAKHLVCGGNTNVAPKRKYLSPDEARRVIDAAGRTA